MAVKMLMFFWDVILCRLIRRYKVSEEPTHNEDNMFLCITGIYLQDHTTQNNTYMNTWTL